MDAVSIDDAARPGAAGRGAEVGLRQAVMLLVIFLLVCSDYMVNNVVAHIPGGTRGREVLSRGVVAQGVLLVLLYALGNYLVELNVI